MRIAAESCQLGGRSRLGLIRPASAANGPPPIGMDRDNRLHRGRELAECLSVVGVEVAESVAERGRERRSPTPRRPSRRHRARARSRAAACRFVGHGRQQERLEASGQLAVAVDNGLDVLGVDVRAHDADRRVASPVDIHERQWDGRRPRQWTARPGDFTEGAEPSDIDARLRDSTRRAVANSSRPPESWTLYRMRGAMRSSLLTVHSDLSERS